MRLERSGDAISRSPTPGYAIRSSPPVSASNSISTPFSRALTGAAASASGPAAYEERQQANADRPNPSRQNVRA